MSDELALYNYGIEEKKINPAIEKAVESIKSESDFWDKMFNIPTPEGNTYEREGPKDKSGQPVILEYIKDSYTIRMLNKLFPGWYQEDMKIEYVPQVNTWIVTGYIVIRYPTEDGLKTRKVWAVGSTEVKISKNSDILKPSQPEDMAKGAYSEWIKLVGKRLGIGIDIFEQSITDEMKQEYVEKVKTWDYTDITDSYVQGINSKKVFKKYVDGLPTPEQALKFKEVVDNPKIPEEKRKPLWDEFQKHKNTSIDIFTKSIKDKIGA